VLFRPKGPAGVVEQILTEVFFIRRPTVNPGFGHQHLLFPSWSKIRRVRQMIEQTNPACEL